MPEKIWNEEIIIERIKKLEKTNKDITWKHIVSVDPTLIAAAESYYGSWKNAVIAAGIDYKEVQKTAKGKKKKLYGKWSTQKIIDTIKELFQKGEDLRFVNMRIKYTDIVGAAIFHIGSWKQAIEKAGLNYENITQESKILRQKKQPKIWYKELLLNELEEMYPDNQIPAEDVVKQTDIEFYKILISHFKKWSNVIKSL